MRFNIFKKKKYDIDFSDENLTELTSSIESLSEFLNRVEERDLIHYFEDIKESALNYDFNRFRKSTKHYVLTGGNGSLNDIIFLNKEIDAEFKTKFNFLLEIIIRMGHNHPSIIKTQRLLNK